MRLRGPQLLLERTAEIEQIEAVLAGAAAGEGSLLLLEGPAGIGKTSLLDAARDRAVDAGAEVLSARGAELEGDFPYGLVRQLFEPTIRAAPAERRERLLAGAGALATPVLLGPATAPAAGAEPTFSVLHGLYWLVANLAGESALTLLIDDIHWSDAQSLRFLVHLARRLDGLPVALIASLRTGEPASDTDLIGQLETGPRATVAVPEPLSDAGVASLLEAEFAQAPDTAFAHSCREATGGNPFFVHELAAAFKSDRIEPTAEERGRVAAAAPQTIARATLVRLGRLPDTAPRLSRAIAVLGGDATLPRAASLAGLGEADALAALDALVWADLIVAGRRLEFRHPVVRAAIYDELAPGARSSAHLQAAALLTTEGAELDTVAAHLLLTQPTGAAETIATLREAASHALALGAPDTAATYLARALEEGPERELRIALLLELGRAEGLAQRPSAVERFEQVRRLTADPATRTQAMTEQAGLLMYGAGIQTALELLDRALEELSGEPDVLRLRAEAMRATPAMYSPTNVCAFVERLPMLRELAQSGRPGARPLAALAAAWDAQRDQPAEEALALAERAWDGGRYLSEGDSVEVLPQVVGVFMLLDQLERAAELSSQIRARAASSGSAWEYVIASSSDVMIEAHRGNLTATAAEMRDAIAASLEFGLQFGVISVLWYGADALLEQPELADLAAMVESIELGPFADVLGGALLVQTRGRLRFAAGDSAGAIADLRHIAGVIDALGFTNGLGSASTRSMLALMLDESERDEALELVGAELNDARRSGSPRRIGIALRARALLEHDQESAERNLLEAVAFLAASPSRLEHARGLVELGSARRRAGNRAAAREPLRDGLDLAARCGATRLADRARTELAATGARPRRVHVSGRDALTPSELRVARLAAERRTSKEIAQALFVTTKTVDGHLNHIYSKLGINSRRQLPEVL